MALYRLQKRPAGAKSMVGLWLLAVLVTEVPILLSGMRDAALLWVGGIVVLAPVLAQVARIAVSAPQIRTSLIVASAVLIVSACLLASQVPKLAVETNLDVTRTASFEEARLALREQGVDLVAELGMTQEAAAAVRAVRTARGGNP